ncbi:hypothetical protein C2845_PM06G10710 [Panicum miliaceum]|uniref:TF-B3 domain-containing protein n=1 Tax=Panicum miliaceum TaxID=4540 RepID=A0A3L6R9F1_PANMI|nr:hypothetical protein C2845_PM06G10710 [Panicum miliaceum]
MAGGGDDKTPEAAAFKNVPRRPRSASPGSAARPREEELGAGGGGSSAPPPSAAARGGGEQQVHRVEERRRLLRAQDAKNGGSGALGRRGLFGGAAPAPSGKEEAAAASASASSSRERGADWAKKERIRKGKMPAAKESPPRGSAYDDDAAPASPRPAGGGKLMGDAIRSHGGSAAARRSKITPRRGSKSKKRKDRGGPPFWYGMGRDGQSTSTAGSELDYSFDKMGAVVSDELRAALGGLGVGAATPQPKRVYGRMMSGCDRNTHQSRLQMSSKSWRAEDGDYPLCAFLTEAEKEAVEDGEGLDVTAYDRRGAAHAIRIGYLGSNRSYRLTKNWGKFLRDNDLVVKRTSKAARAPKDVMLDLWLFRTPEGKVGMVILHYRKGEAAHADAALDEEERRTRPRLADNASTPEATSSPEPDGGAGGDDAAMEDVAGGVDEKGQGDTAGAPSPSEPDDGGGAKAGEAGQAGGAPSEVAAAPFSPDADGTKTEEKEAGGAPTEAAAHSSSEGVMEQGAGAAPGDADGTKTEGKEASAAPTEAAAQSSSSDTAGGAANAAGKEAAPPPSPPDAKNDDGPAPPVAPPLWFGFGLTQHEFLAAHALVLLSLG